MLPFVTQALRAVEAAFNRRGFRLWLVGGCVRDWMIGVDPKDIDLCTDATPEEQIAIYVDLGLAYYPTGIDFGTISVMVGATLYEVTTLRTESEHDGRHATVAFTRDLAEDLGRRDLTINAMAMTMEGDLIDPFGGARDLEDGVVRFVGEAAQRIEDDYLRILRFVRFHGRYGRGLMDPAAAAACALYGHGLRGISGERIWVEMGKIAAHDSGPRMIREMLRLGLGAHVEMTGEVLPERFDIAHAGTRNPVSLMCALVKNWTPIAKRWRWSKDETKLAKFLENRLYGPPQLNNLKFALACENASPAHVYQWALATGASDLYVQIKAWDVPTMPISGDDCLAAGYSGKDVGAALMAARLTWALNGYKTSREDMMTMLQKVQQASGG